MKTNFVKHTWIGIVIFIFSGSQLFAQQPADSISVKKDSIVITAEVNYLKHYLWRGLLFGSNDISQPFVNIVYRNFYLNLAPNCNLARKNLPKEYYVKPVRYDEQDVEIGYGSSLGKFDFEVKTMAYFYFNQVNAPNTAELAARISYPVYKEFRLFSENTGDIYSYRGSLYSSNGMEWENSFGNEDISFVSMLNFSSKKFNDAYTGAELSGLLSWGNRLEFTHNFRRFYCTLAGEFYNYTSKKLREASGLKNATNFSVSIGKEIILKKKR